MGRFFDVDLEQAETADMDVTLAENVRFKLKIAGSKSAAYANAMTSARALAKRMAKRHGSDALSYEDQKEVVQFRAARVIVGWDGIKVPFAPAEADALLAEYPTLVHQVIAFSDADENFIRPCASVAGSGSSAS
jgi:hypothetical protein